MSLPNATLSTYEAMTPGSAASRREGARTVAQRPDARQPAFRPVSDLCDAWRRGR